MLQEYAILTATPLTYAIAVIGIVGGFAAFVTDLMKPADYWPVSSNTADNRTRYVELRADMDKTLNAMSVDDRTSFEMELYMVRNPETKISE